MKILMVATNRAREPMPVMPYGACLAAEAAERAGHSVELLDLMFERDPHEALGRAVGRVDPHAVAFSVRNVDNNDAAAPRVLCGELRSLVGLVRSRTEAWTILGGAAVGVMPEALLSSSGADWAVMGDGERVFPELLARLDEGVSPQSVPGVARLERGALRAARPEHMPLGSAPSVPDFRRWLKLGAYRARLAAAPLQTKRGCPYGCVYCTYSAHEGKCYRLHAPAAVADAVARLAAQGCRDVEFVDNVFNSPRTHALDICRELIAAHNRSRLVTLELNPAFVDSELLEAMERAGFAGIGITAESASDRVLEGLDKNFRRNELDAAAAAVAKSRLPCLWIFLLGGPNETEATAAETIRFAERHVRPMDAAYFNVGLRIYPHTQLERIALAENVISRPLSNSLDPVFYLAPGLNFARLRGMVAEAVKRNMSFMNSAAFAHPLLPAATRLAGAMGLRPPLWRHARTIRRAFNLVGKDL